MTTTGGEARTAGRRMLVAGAGLVVVVMLMIYLRSLGRSPRNPPGRSRSAGASTSPASGPASTAPATGPATRAASRPAPKWKRPRFSARQAERDRMVRVIRAYRLTDGAVLAAMGHVPRHQFVLKRLQGAAYADRPLPIGYGQTISQPYIVAEMTRHLKLTPKSRVLEIGTGSGYQAAVLAEFTPHVYSIEIVKELADAAAGRLKRLGYSTVSVRHADGYYGWAKHAPFDAIIVTCAAGQIPPPLIKQLAPGGRMIIPVGARYARQFLMLVEKLKDGTLRSRNLMGVRFVPFVHKPKAGR